MAPASDLVQGMEMGVMVGSWWRRARWGKEGVEHEELPVTGERISKRRSSSHGEGNHEQRAG